MKISRPDPTFSWWLLHVAAGFTISFIPAQLRSGKSIWALPSTEIHFIAGIIIAYWTTAILLTLLLKSHGNTLLRNSTLAFFAAFGSYALYILITESFYSRSLLAVSLILSIIFLALALFLESRIRRPLVIALAIMAVAMQIGGSRPTELMNKILDLEPKPHITKSFIDSHLYSLDAVEFRHYFDVCPTNGRPCEAPPTGGGLSRLGTGYLLSTGDGTLHYFTVDASIDVLKTRRLKSRVPINSSVYESGVGPNTHNTFRVTGTLLREYGDEFELLAAHHFWKPEEKCGVLRVSRTGGSRAQFLADDRAFEWKTIYETTPCLPATDGHLTRGSESGGRMAVLGNGKLLLTVGDHQYDGLSRQPIAAQDPGNSYGKTILIDMANGQSRVYSLGHRNPQGLFVDDQGTIWSTEHGPKGGDEINIIKDGANYGWPLATFGTQYGTHAWPLNVNQGRHEGFQKPIFAWTPSIAVSDLIRLQDGIFPLWRGDLLIASFTKALYRVRLDEGRVINMESIPITGRLRHLLQASDGKIVTYLDSGTVIFLSPAAEGYGSSSPGRDKTISQKLRGEYLFSNCSGCHALRDGSSHGIGPDLGKIVGRAIGGASGFSYSDALKTHGGAWDQKSLDTFLANPRAFSPGTSMAFDGMPDPSDRAALIDFLSR